MKLVISEKEIAAKRIAKILSGNGITEEKIYGVPLWYIKFNGDDCAVIGLQGHILKVDFPEQYANWFKIDPVELIYAPIDKVPIHKKIIQALKKIAEKIDQVIIATDYDREGELIGYDAWKVIEQINKVANVKRARFSAITETDINNAFMHPDKIDVNLAFAGRARQDIDLIWGAVLTRFISLASYQVKDKFLSVGRVQSPTLTLIVERELEIKNFIPTPFWVINIKFKTSKDEIFEATHYKKKFLKKEEAEKVFKKIGSTNNAQIIDISEKIKSISPPIPFNTTGLIVAANSIGFSAAKTISTAENLYMNGYISYPRTDNTVYPNSIDLAKVASMLSGVSDFKNAVKDVLAQEKIIPTKGKKKTTDHPPIYPTSAAEPDKLSEDEYKLYELVCRRFLCTLLPPAEMKSITIKLDVEGEIFTASGSYVIKAGWIEHYPYYKHEDIILPEVKVGEILEIIDRMLNESQTKPPPRFTQGKLVEKMEELGLGTKATRHTIIQNLISRGYIRGNPLVPSEKAIAVVKILQKHAERISTPEMTSELEIDMDNIAKGEKTKEEVVEKSRRMLKEVMVKLENGKAEISQEIKKAIKEDTIIGSCVDKNCNGNLMIRVSRKTKKRFIGCSNYPQCTQTFSLPQKGMIIPAKELCKHCGYPIVKVIVKGRKPWDLCINSECPGKNEKNKNFRNKKEDKATAD